MTEHTAIWDALGKTDPGATKPFKRGGGFSGTSVKPMWVLRRLTEQFGPAGQGWGVLAQPTFQVVPGDNREVLVYCTVSCWHGTKDNVLWGVGGDKVVTYIKANAQYNRPERWESDDEAFKKAFTDAVNNAFKSIGVAADIHMGLFDDDKYVSQMREEFEDKPEPPVVIDDGQYAEIVTLAAAAGVPVARILETAKVETLRDLPATDYEAVRKKLNLTIDANTAKKEAA